MSKNSITVKRVNEKAGNIYQKMETDVFFDIKMVTADKQQRKRGLATDLLRRSIELAKNLGFKAIKTEATGKNIYVRSDAKKVTVKIK